MVRRGRINSFEIRFESQLWPQVIADSAQVNNTTQRSRTGSEKANVGALFGFEANIKKNPLIVTVSGLFNFFSKTYQLHELQAQGKSENDILKALELRSEWFLKDYRAATRQYSKAQLENAISQLRRYDLRSKGIETDTTNNGDEQLMKELFFKILNQG